MSEIITVLNSLGLINIDRLENFYPRVRDRDDIIVLRDTLTEVIVLSRNDHVEGDYYLDKIETKDDFKMKPPRLEDNIRREIDFGGYIRNKRWLDFGCGLGGLLNVMADEAEWAVGLEPNKDRSAIVSANGHRVIASMEDLEFNSIDVITMFHVFEHLSTPLETLSIIRKYLKLNGVLLIEVPNARDALITLYNCNEFKKFTFWSEHLVLHTRESLKGILKSAGFKSVEIIGCQRYPLSNHLYWLSNNMPGGHDIWRFLTTAGLRSEYEALLNSIDKTDTLIAIVRID